MGLLYSVQSSDNSTDLVSTNHEPPAQSGSVSSESVYGVKCTHTHTQYTDWCVAAWQELGPSFYNSGLESFITY